MTAEPLQIALLAIGYLSGSVPYGLLLARRVRGVDVRAQGSGNIGAANVARVAGKKIAIAVLLLDVLKGAAPVWLAAWLLHGSRSDLLPTLAGLAAFLGHLFPIWLKGRGGKGVATGLGVILATMPPTVPAAAVFAFVVAFALGRVSSVASLSAATAALATGLILPVSVPHRLLLGALWAMLLWAHRANIGRLLHRQENRF